MSPTPGSRVWMPNPSRCSRGRVNARRLDYFHALEAEHANLVLAEDAVTGLRQALGGQFVSDSELDEGLGVTPVR